MTEPFETDPAEVPPPEEAERGPSGSDGTAAKPARRARSAGWAAAGPRSRRYLAGRARRRRRFRLLALVTALAVVAVAVYLVVSLVGGEEQSGTAAESPAPTQTSDLVLLRVTQQEKVRTMALFGSAGKRKLVLGIPANTLLQGPTGFRSASEMLAGDGFPTTAAALKQVLGYSPSSTASVSWEELAAAGKATAEPSAATSSLPSDSEGATLVAKTIAALGRKMGESTVKAAVQAMQLEGDEAEARAALAALASAPKLIPCLPGKTVEGTGFTYYEPDATRAKALLGASADPGGVSVEVQNGSGAIAVAERVSQALQPLGYTLLPPRNADQFPNVASTQIFAASDVLAEADRVRKTLDRGKVVEQATLPQGRIVVIVGKDIPVDSLPALSR